MKIQLDGFKELDAALSQLKRSTAKGVLRRVGRAALEPVRARAAALAPEDTGLLEDRVIISSRQQAAKARRRKPEGPNEVQLYMGPARGAAAIRGQMQEFGTANQPPQPFMRPAWDGGKMDVLKAIGRDLGSEIEKTAKRVAKRAAKGK